MRIVQKEEVAVEESPSEEESIMKKTTEEEEQETTTKEEPSKKNEEKAEEMNEKADGEDPESSSSSGDESTTSSSYTSSTTSSSYISDTDSDEDSDSDDEDAIKKINEAKKEAVCSKNGNGIRHIKFVELPYRNCNVRDYNKICLHKETLYKHCSFENLLFFQTDSIILNPSQPLDLFLKYVYVGAPWRFAVGDHTRELLHRLIQKEKQKTILAIKKNPTEYRAGILQHQHPNAHNPHVGNGGFSLRKKSVCLKALDWLKENGIYHLNEDIAYIMHLRITTHFVGVPRVYGTTSKRNMLPGTPTGVITACPKNIASKFSVEHWFPEFHSSMRPKAIPGLSREAAPLGIHKIWRFIPKSVLAHWVQEFPLLRELMHAQHLAGKADVPLEKYFGLTAPRHIPRAPGNITAGTQSPEGSTTTAAPNQKNHGTLVRVYRETPQSITAMRIIQRKSLLDRQRRDLGFLQHQ
jgi:hypothetical protein